VVETSPSCYQAIYCPLPGLMRPPLPGLGRRRVGTSKHPLKIKLVQFAQPKLSFAFAFCFLKRVYNVSFEFLAVQRFFQHEYQCVHTDTHGKSTNGPGDGRRRRYYAPAKFPANGAQNGISRKNDIQLSELNLSLKSCGVWAERRCTFMNSVLENFVFFFVQPRMLLEPGEMVGQGGSSR